MDWVCAQSWPEQVLPGIQMKMNVGRDLLYAVLMISFSTI
jgi:hypothetical protein